MIKILLTDHDNQYLETKLRNDFDSLTDVHQYDTCVELIKKAERWGYKELAEQMRNDLNIPTRKQVTGSPTISDQAEEIMKQEPAEIMVEQYNSMHVVHQ